MLKLISQGDVPESNCRGWGVVGDAGRPTHRSWRSNSVWVLPGFRVPAAHLQQREDVSFGRSRTASRSTRFSAQGAVFSLAVGEEIRVRRVIACF